METYEDLHYDMTPSPVAASGSYRPLEFERSDLPVKQIREVALAIFAAYVGKRLGVTASKKLGRVTITWSDHSGAAHQTRPFSFDDVCAHLRQTGSFDPATFGLGPLLSRWLDGAVEISPRFHAPSIEETSP